MKAWNYKYILYFNCLRLFWHFPLIRNIFLLMNLNLFSCNSLSKETAAARAHQVWGFTWPFTSYGENKPSACQTFWCDKKYSLNILLSDFQIPTLLKKTSLACIVFVYTTSHSLKCSLLFTAGGGEPWCQSHQDRGNRDQRDWGCGLFRTLLGGVSEVRLVGSFCSCDAPFRATFCTLNPPLPNRLRLSFLTMWPLGVQIWTFFVFVFRITD